jgi:hypothetical protein
MIIVIRALMLIVMLLSLNATLVGEQKPAKPPGCGLIDKKYLPLSISYDRVGTSSTVELRLLNNTDCTILVQTDDESPRRPYLVDGRIRIETTTESEDGLKVPLHYLLKSQNPRLAPSQGYGWGDSVFTYRVLGGQSIIFSVPIVKIRKGFDVLVPFNYEWENVPFVPGGPVSHTVQFSASNLPRSVFSR